MKTLKLFLNILIIVTSLLGSTYRTLAQGQPNAKKVYIAKVYLSDNNTVRGILYSAGDSSITICVDTALIKYDPLNDSLKMTSISYQDITRIKVIRKGAIGKGFLIGALSGSIPGIIMGSAVNSVIGAIETIGSLGSVSPQPDPTVTVVFALAGMTMGGLIGAAIGTSSKQFYIYNSLEKYNIEKERLAKYAILNNIFYTTEKIQHWEPDHFD